MFHSWQAGDVAPDGNVKLASNMTQLLLNKMRYCGGDMEGGIIKNQERQVEFIKRIFVEIDTFIIIYLSFSFLGIASIWHNGCVYHSGCRDRA